MVAALGMKTPRIVKSVTTTYPGFHGLPKGIKQMLLVSESFFFGEARPTADAKGRAGSPLPAGLASAIDTGAHGVTRPTLPRTEFIASLLSIQPHPIV